MEENAHVVIEEDVRVVPDDERFEKVEASERVHRRQSVPVDLAGESASDDAA